MVLKYLLATLSALANKITPSLAIETNDDGNAYTFNKEGINYLNVSPTWGRFLKRKKRKIDLLPKSIIMMMVLVLFFAGKASAQITFADFSKVYGTADFTGVATTSSGNPINYSIGGAYSSIATTDGTNIHLVGVGSAQITADDGGASAPVTVTLTVTPATLTITGLIANNKVYDQGVTASFTGGTLNGIVGSDNVTLNASGTFASQNVANGIAVTSTSTLGGAQAGNYTLTQPGGLTANITPVTLTISGLTASNKVYDRTTAATLSGGSLVGIIAGDVVTFTPIGTFASANVGVGIAVTSTTTLGGAQGGNYTLTQPSGITANITPVALTITGATATNRAYDGTTTVAINTTTGPAVLNGVLAGDAVTIAGSPTGSVVSAAAGNGKTVTVTGFALGGAQAGNYTLTQPSVNVNITPKIITVTGVTSSSKVYNGTTTATLSGTPAFSGVLAADVGNVIIGGTPTANFSSSQVGGPYTISLVLPGYTKTGSAAANYTILQPTFSASITPATLTVTGLTANNKVYDKTTTATIGGSGTLSGVIGADVVTLSGSPTANFSTANVGVAIPITVTGYTLGGAQAGNYTLTSPSGFSANITAKALTISTAAASNKTYDGTTTATVTGTLTGVIAGDACTLTPSGTFASANVGTGLAVTSTSTLSGAQAGNYTLTQPGGLTANITAAALTVNAAAASNKAYDGTFAATITGTLSGVIGGDVVTLNGVGTFVSKNVANGIAVTSACTLGGAQGGNYTLTQPTGLTANITKAALTITSAGASNKTYDGTMTATLSGTLSGVIAGDAVTLTLSGTFASANAGTGIAVTSTSTLGGAQAGNYTLTQPSGITANINGAPLTLTATGPTKTAGVASPNGSYTTNFTASGMIAGQTVTSVTLTFNPTTAQTAGQTYTVTPSAPIGGGGFLASNYIITPVAYNGTVSNTILTITASNVTQTYGSVDISVVTVTYSGFVNGDTQASMIVLPSVGTTATNTSNAGSYPITASGAVAPSGYTINYVPGTFTIAPVPIIIQTTGPSKAAGASLASAANAAYWSVTGGPVNGETISTVYLTVNPTTPQTAGQSYTVTPGFPITGANGFLASNYSISWVAYGGTCGANYTWNGNTSSAWMTTSNWTPNGTPTSNDNIFIPAGTPNAPAAPNANTTVNFIQFTGPGTNSLTIPAGIKLTILNGLTVDASVTANMIMGSTGSNLVIGTTTSRSILSNSGNFNMAGGTLTITYGLNYVYNSGNFILNGGNIFHIGGTSGQLAFGNDGTFRVGTSNSSCTLIIDNSQSLQNNASGNFYVGSTSGIYFADPNSHDSHFINATGGNFTFQSDQYGSACVGAIPLNPARPNSFDGNFTVERYLTAFRGYRLIASPVYSTTVGSNKVYSLNYVQNTAYISGNNASGGFDKNSLGPTLYLWNETKPVFNSAFIGGNYRSINNLLKGYNTPPVYDFDSGDGTFSLPVTNGFLFFYRGNRNDPTYSMAKQFTAGTPALAATMSTTGKLTQQQVTFADWYTPGSTAPAFSNGDIRAQGFNLAANPYASNIDLNTYQTNAANTTTGIYAKNISKYIYELNPITQNYDTYDAVGHIALNSASRYVMSGQGFFVLATNTGGQLTFNESAKVTSSSAQNTGPQLLMGKPDDLADNEQHLRLQMAKDTVNTDEMIIRFDNSAKPIYDNTEDAPYKQGSGQVSLASVSSDHIPLAINLTPLNKKGQTISVSVNAKTDGIYTLNMNQILGIPRFYDVWLMDAYAKDSLDMRANKTYSFNISRADTASYGAYRFSLVLRQNPDYAYRLLNFNAQKVSNTREVETVWNTKYEENYTNFTVERSTDNGKTFHVLGGVKASGQGTYSFLDKDPIIGLNLYRLKQEDVNNTISYSKVIPVGYSGLSNSLVKGNISAFPNPTSSNINLGILAASDASVTYNILITNSTGLVVKQVGSTQINPQLNVSDWLPGTYIVKVFNKKDQSLVGTTKFVKL